MAWQPRPGTLGEKIVEYLAEHPEGATDSDLKQLFQVDQAHVNMTCRLLEGKGMVVRRKFAGLSIRNHLADGATVGITRPIPAAETIVPSMEPVGFLDLEDALSKLARTRPIFHSEADFQHALAWQIHKDHPDCHVRLEFKAKGLVGTAHLDLWLKHGDIWIAIELKYKTASLTANYLGEEFALISQNAQDLGRYDFWKDIQRLENVVAVHSNTWGLAVFLTNDSNYWKAGGGATIDSLFRMHGPEVVSGERKWGVGASEGTKAKRESPISLRGAYSPVWRNYSDLNLTHGKFNYLALEVKHVEPEISSFSDS